MTKFDVENPSTGEVIKTYAFTEEAEIHHKIERAYEAYLSWREVDAHERSRLLWQWSTLIKENREALAELITLEGGKPYQEALGEVDYAVGYVDWYAEEVKRIYGRTIPANSPDKKILVDKFPVGVVGAITPWNFPAAMITRKMAPALAAGCTIVCKPATQTPMTTIRLVELAHEAGIPEDAISYILASGKTAGKIFTEHELINKVTFTGSTPVGKKLIEQSAASVKMSQWNSAVWHHSSCIKMPTLNMQSNKRLKQNLEMQAKLVFVPTVFMYTKTLQKNTKNNSLNKSMP